MTVREQAQAIASPAAKVIELDCVTSAGTTAVTWQDAEIDVVKM